MFLGGVLVATSGTQLNDSLDTNVRELQLLPEDAPRHALTQPHRAVLWVSEGVNITISFSSRDRSALTAALKLSAVDGKIINFSPFSWAIRTTGQDVHNQARN